MRHPDFPSMPRCTPLTFVLAMKACLSADLAERPTFGDLQLIFDDVIAEVASGHYINSAGQAQVCCAPLMHASGSQIACALYSDGPPLHASPSAFFKVYPISAGEFVQKLPLLKQTQIPPSPILDQAICIWSVAERVCHRVLLPG